MTTDNVVFGDGNNSTPPDLTNIATRAATHAGDTSNVQVISVVAVTGSEGSRTIREVLIQDDAAFAPGTDAVLMVGATFDDSSPDSVNEGDAGAVRMSARRELYVQLRDAAGNERGLNIDGSGNVTVNVTGTVTVNSHAVTNAGTFAVQVDGAALTSLQLIDDIVATLGTTTYSETTTKGAVIGAVRRDADTTLVDTTNEIGPLQMNAAGQLKVEAFSGETLPVSLASVPSHAVTNAGTFAVQVDGAALTSLQLIDDTVVVLGTDTYTEATSKGLTIGAVRRDADTTLVNTTNEWGPLQMDANGRLKVEAFSGEVLPVSDNSSSLSVDWNGTQPVTGSGNATGALRVELPTNGTGIVGLAAGTNGIGKLTANSGVDIGDVDVTSISAGSNLIGDVGIQPRTTNGLTTAMFSGSDGSSILVATAQVVKASAGKLYGYYAYNPESATTFVHFYNTAAASVTVGTTNPLFTLPIPPGGAANLISDIGITFSNAGWSVAATTTAGGNTAPSTGVSLVCWYA